MESPHKNNGIVDSEVLERPVRRKFPDSFKLKILDETDRCSEKGGIGRILRREGIYWSQLTTWRRTFKKREIRSMKGNRTVRKVSGSEEKRALRRQVEKLTRQLEHANAVIDFQKKIAELLGTPLKSGDSIDND